MFMKRLIKAFGEPEVFTTDKAPVLLCAFKKLKRKALCAYKTEERKIIWMRVYQSSDIYKGHLHRTHKYFFCKTKRSFYHLYWYSHHVI
ncbi:hypothetical protein A9498_29005 (plasmid) [Bacillus thuringiensis serovar coreanensis]|nr:hypothetical protein A9498_29005 [Bacillus thuringiensis serovar coreanensis]